MASVQTRRDGRITEIRMMRVDAGNALNAELVDALHDAIRAAAEDDGDTVLLRGEGKGFCGGFDLSNLETESDASLLQRFVAIELMLQDLVKLPKRTVALAHRFAYGAGADIFAACRMRVAAPGTRLSFPGVRFGIILGTGRLALTVGPDAATEILSTPGFMTAEDAEAKGLVHRRNAVEEWGDLKAGLRDGRSAIPRDMAKMVSERLDTYDHDGDLAALVRSAARPGLRDRLAAYAETVTRKR